LPGSTREGPGEKERDIGEEKKEFRGCKKGRRSKKK
jgi:hypothetical protein